MDYIFVIHYRKNDIPKTLFISYITIEFAYKILCKTTLEIFGNTLKKKEELSVENAVNQRILKLCEERGYSIYRLSTLSGIPTSTITSILKRNNAPTIPTLQKICSALDLTLAQFFSEGFDTLTESQAEYLSEFSKLNAHDKELVLAYIKGLNDSKDRHWPS